MSKEQITFKSVTEEFLASGQVPLETYGNYLNPKPLFFVHIPKTAGASIQLFLADKFDEDQIFPGWNPNDLAHHNGDTKKYLLFRGHFTAGQSIHSNDLCELFTVLRNPVSQTHSFYMWLRSLQPSYWKESDAVYKSNKTERLERNRSDTHAQKAIDLAKTSDFCKFIARNDPLTRRFCDNIAMTHLSDIGSDVESINKAYKQYILDGSTESRTLLSDSAWRNLRRCIVAGVTEELNKSLLLLAYKRHWPASIGLDHIHKNRPSNADMSLSENEIELIHQHTEIDQDLYEFSSKQVTEEWAKLVSLAGGEQTISDYINQSHIDYFFSAAPSATAVNLSAKAAWPGLEWGRRETNEHGQTWRWIGDKGNSSLLVKINNSSKYVVSVFVHTAIDVETLASLQVTIQGNVLPFAGSETVDGYAVRSWVIEEPIIKSCRGCIQIEFSIAPTSARFRLALARICCYPLQ